MKFADTDTKISKITEDGTYKVQNRSGLSLVKRGNSKYFEGKFRFPFRRVGAWAVVPEGVWKVDIQVEEAIEKWLTIKRWSKENNLHPKFFNEPIREDQKTFAEVSKEWMEMVYKPITKERTWRTSRNRLNQMMRYIDEVYGKNLLIESFSRSKIKKMLLDLFVSGGRSKGCQLKRCRQLLTWILAYAVKEGYIDVNPIPSKFDWERGIHKEKGNHTLAGDINSKSWGEVPRFLSSVNENSCNGSTLTTFAVKAHLMMCIRSGVVVRLKWNWYQPEEDMWVIPAQTEGLKRKLGDEKSVHHIPSTPEINLLMEKIRAITGWHERVFYSLGGTGNKLHLGEETINDHLKNLGWHGKQSAHGWRDVITTAAQEHGGFDYEIINRQLGRREHMQGTRGHYDHSTLLPRRKEFMEWWTKQLVEQGLEI